MDSLQLGSIIFIIPALIASLSRILQTGWLWIYLAHIIITFLVILLYVYRRRCSLAFKIHLSCIFFILICFLGAIKFSTSGAMYYSCMAVLFSVLTYGKRIGIIYATIAVTGLIIISILHGYKVINTNIDFNLYNNSTIGWANSIIGLTYVLIMCISFVDLFYNYFNNGVTSLIQKTKDQEIIQADLKASEERYSVLINNALIPIIVTNYEGDLIFANYAVEKLFDVNFSKSKGNKLLDLWENPEVRIEMLEKIRENGYCQNVEASFYTDKNEIITLLLSANSITYNGMPAILSILQNITDQKTAEIIKKKNEQLVIEKERAEISERTTKELLEKLKKSKEEVETSELKYRQAQEIGHIGNWEYDIRNNVFWGSDEAKRIYGFSRNDQNFSFEQVTKRVINRSKADAAFDALLKNNKPYNIELEIQPLKSTEKKIIYSIAELIKDEHGVATKITGILQDITEKKYAEAALKESEERYRSIVTNSLMGIILRSNTKLIFVNEAFCNMIGYSEEELMSMTLLEFMITFHPDDRDIVYQRHLDLIAKKPVPNKYEIRRIHKSGRIIWVDSVTQNVSYGGSDVQLGMYIEITERKKAEEEMHRLTIELRELANHLQTVREEERLLIANEIHDKLAQNLVALNMNANYIKTSIKDSNLKLKEVIDEQIDIANDLVKTSRTLFNSLHLAALDELGLFESIEWYAKDQLKEYRIDVLLESNVEGFLFTKELSYPLFRIAQEAISNIKLYSKATTVFISLSKENNVLSLLIKDDGVGFETSSRYAINNHGLLGIRERVYALNGKLNIESKLGEGTSIHIEVPLD